MQIAPKFHLAPFNPDEVCVECGPKALRSKAARPRAVARRPKAAKRAPKR